MDHALRAVQESGKVTLPGEPAVWSSMLRWLFRVLMGLVGLLAVGGLVFVLIALASGIRMTAATILGVVMVYAMLAAGMALLIVGLRKHSRTREKERHDVTIDAQGMTLRGIGPIPWEDFGSAEHRMVRPKHDSGWVRRAVMPLTASGLLNVNERMRADLRDRIGPAEGPFWNRHHRWIYVPGVEGLRQAEVMELINTAHSRFSV